MLRLYKAHCKKLLFSPFTYFLSAAFTIFCTLQYFLLTKFFTPLGSSDLHRYFSSMPYAAILIIPAYSQALSFTKKELELPFSSFELVFSKILSLFTTFILLSLIPGLVLPITVSFFGKVDFALTVTGYIGLSIYLLSSFSLCVFFSFLFQNPAVSFIISALLLLATHTMHMLPQVINLNQGLSTLVQYFSFAWHFDTFGKGILDTRHIFFYLLTSGFFYFLSILALEKKRGELSPFTKKLLLPSLACLLLLFSNTSLYYARADFSAGKEFSVSPYSKSLLSHAEQPVNIRYYRSPLLKNLYPQIHDVEEYLRIYAEENSLVKLSLLDPSKDEEKLNSLGIQAQSLQTASGDSTSYARVYSAVILDYLDESEVIPFVLDTRTLEYDLTSRLSSLLTGRKRSLQVLVGNGMKLSEDYSYVKPWLESQGFSVQETFMPSESSGFTKPSFALFPQVPLLLLGSVHFEYGDSLALMERIRQGSKNFIATTPYTIDLANEWQVIEAPQDDVIYQLESFGIHFADTLTADISNFPLSMYSDSNANGESAAPRTEYVNYSLWPVLLPQKNAPNGMTTFWPSSLNLYSDVAEMENYTLEPYLVTSSGAWLYEKAGKTFVTNPFAVPLYPENKELLGQKTLAALLKRDGEPSTIVWADQYSLNSSLIAFTSSQTPDLRSLSFLSDSLLLLNGEADLLYLKNKNIQDTSLSKVSPEELSSSAFATITLTLFIEAALIAIFAITIFILRKKRRLL